MRHDDCANPVRRAGKHREAHKRPLCSVCGQRAEAPGAERPRDWWIAPYGHRDAAGTPCPGEWIVADNVYPLTRSR